MNAVPHCHPSLFFIFNRLGVRASARRFGLTLALLSGCLVGVAPADQFGDFTYTDTGTSITIDDYPVGATGVVVVPPDIVGKPVTAIGPQAFALCSGITGVTLPPSVTSIGTQAFFNCTALTSVGDIPNVSSIGDGAFFACVNLMSVTLSPSISVIGNSVFDSCRALTTMNIPSGVSSIGSGAFSSCSGLTSVTIPTTVTSLGPSAFSFCSELTSVVLPDGLGSIPSGLFSDCTKLDSITIPLGVSAIGGGAFAKCSSLSSIAIPAGVTSIGTFAFSQCASLLNVVIPSGVPSIGTSTFELCTALESVTIPYSVVSIGNNAFRSCTSLTSFYLPTTSINTIGSNVFEGCSSLQSIEVSSSSPSYSSQNGALFNKAQTTLLVYPRGKVGPCVIPFGVTFIGAEAFRFCVGVTGIEIPTTVSNYGVDTFVGCSALTSFTVLPGGSFLGGTGSLYSLSGKSLLAYPGGLGGNVVIPSTVTTVSVSAFRYNDTLTSVTFPVSIVTVRDTAFANCSQLTSATFEGIAPVTFFGTNVFLAAAPTFSVYFSTTATTGFTVPTWKGYPASAIGPNASVVNWLMGYQLPSDSDMTSDANGDGVSLLMAYALNLNPNQNLTASIPQPVFTAGEMSMSFYAGAEGVTYVVEVSPDMLSWGSEGVTESEVDLVRTASASRTGASRFMRLAVSY